MEEYLAYLQLFWKYFAYIFYTFVFLTFLPKTLSKIKKFADADYEANLRKYHRCYGPDLCCHNFIEYDDAPKVTKPRNAVSRGYLRKQQSAQQLRYDANAPTPHHQPTPQQQKQSLPIKRQVQASSIQTNTNVNQIAKMFESGNGGSMAHKKINRVLPEIRTTRTGSIDIELFNDEDGGLIKSHKNNNKATSATQLSRLLQENIENSMNLLHQQTQSKGNSNVTATASTAAANDSNDENWQPALALQTMPRRTCAVPNSLTYAGTSATPSTASPAASTPHSSPSPPNSPVLRAPPLNLKTSVEDIFAALARSAEKNEEHFLYADFNSLSPVTSIDDILSQRRLSRPLSAYSISDLLNDESNFNRSNSQSITNSTSNNNNNNTTELNHNGDDCHHQVIENTINNTNNNNNNDENIFNENLLIAIDA